MTGTPHTRLSRAFLLAGLAAAAALRAAPAPPPVSFRADVAPILRERCAGCHDGRKAKGKYRLDSFQRLLAPGVSGKPPIVAGDPAASPLHRLLVTADADDRMPKDADPLPAVQAALIGRWIAEGARFDGPDPAAPLESVVVAPPHPAPPARYPRPLPVAALAFRPGGDELASGGYHEVLVFDAARGALARRLTNLPERVAGLAWSPDGARVAVAGGTPGRDGEVVLADASGGGDRVVLARGPDAFLSVAFSPDGKRVLAGGTDNAVSCHDAATGRREWFLAHHADWVTGIAWAADGGRFVTSSRDRTARVCDGATGEALASYTEHGAAVLAAVLSPDGKQAWTAGRDAKVRAWDAANSDTRRELGGFDGEVTRLVVAGDAIVAGSVDGRVRQYLAADPGKVFDYSGPGVAITSLASDAASRRLAAGAEDGTIRVWKRDEATPERAFLGVP